MKVYQLLEEKPEIWCKGETFMAADGSGITTVADLKCGEVPRGTVKMCLYGLIWKCYPNEQEYKIAQAKVIQKLHYAAIWNDKPERTVQDDIAVTKELDV